MMASARSRLVALFGLAVSLATGEAACFISPLPGDEHEPVELRLSVAGPGFAASSAALSAGDLWDKTGLFQLSRHPKLVRVAVESDGQELAAATWPDPEQGFGSGEGLAGEVEVTLRAPAGNDRRLRALGFVVDVGRVLVYEEEAAPLVDLVAGKDVELELALVRSASGTLSATVRCETGTIANFQPVALSLVDARAQVLHPPQPLVKDVIGALSVEIRSVPAGRPHWARFTLESRTREQLYLDWRAPTFAFGASNETQAVSFVLPCP